MFSTCDEDGVVDPVIDLDATVIGSIHGTVKNATTLARLGGVTVSWVSGDTVLAVQSTTTDDLGFYLIRNLNPGSYTISFTGKSGFTEHTGTAYIAAASEVTPYGEDDTQGTYYVSENLDATLHELTAGFSGVIWATREDGSSMAASGAVVQFDLSSTTIAPNVYSTTSGSDGLFSLTGLPAGAAGVLYVLPFDNGTDSYATNNVLGTTTLISGEVKNIGDVMLSLATGTPFLVNSDFEGKEGILVGATLSGTFSKTIDSASFAVSISGYSPGSGALAITWADGITFTITPSIPFAVGTFYSFVTLTGLAVDGNSFNFSTGSFTTEAGIALLSTNLWTNENFATATDFPITSAIGMTFSRAVDLANANTDPVLRNANSDNVDVAFSLSSDGLDLTITPTSNLAAGQTYSLSGNVASTLDNDVSPFFSISFTTATASVDLPGQVTSVVHDTTSGDWPVDYNSTFFNFEWLGVSGADGFNIYAKDTYNNQNYVEVATRTVGDNQTSDATYSLSFSLPSLFDHFTDDGITTPFSHGTTVSFIIRAYNAAGEGAASSAITLADKQIPTQFLSSQSSTTDNTGRSTVKIVTVNLSTGEYLSRTGTTVSIVGSSVSTVLEWNSTNTGGTVTITIPADSTMVGKNLTINMLDVSGNTAPDVLLLN